MLNNCPEWDKWVLNGRGGRSVAYTVLVWSRLNAAVELSTRYTTPDTTIEIGSTSATME